jgi:hypothetical protein
VRRRPVRSAAGAIAAAALMAAIPAFAPVAWRSPQAMGTHAALGDTAVDFDDSIRSGLASLERGEPGQALVQFQRALRERQDGRAAALAGVAALRSELTPGEARVFLRNADEWDHASIEHENNRAVCELRSGNIDAAHARLTPLLDTASKEILPTVLLNWMEAELQQSLRSSRSPNRKLVADALAKCATTAWHDLGVARLRAAELRARGTPADRDQVLDELFTAAKRAASAGVSRQHLEVVAKTHPELRDDFRWRSVIDSAPTQENAVPKAETTLIPPSSDQVKRQQHQPEA